MNWYKKANRIERFGGEAPAWSSVATLDQWETPRKTETIPSVSSSIIAVRVLSEPNTVTDWGQERRAKTKSGGEVWEGNYGTRRYLHRDENGKIDSALLIGRQKGQKHWRELLIHTREDKRRQGLATLLNGYAVADVGNLLSASEYSAEGQAFHDSLGAQSN